jgi:hypothetical protein
MAVTMKINVFRDVVHQILQKVQAGLSNMLVNFYHSIQYHIPNDSNPGVSRFICHDTFSLLNCLEQQMSQKTIHELHLYLLMA